MSLEEYISRNENKLDFSPLGVIRNLQANLSDFGDYQQSSPLHTTVYFTAEFSKFLFFFRWN